MGKDDNQIEIIVGVHLTKSLSSDSAVITRLSDKLKERGVKHRIFEYGTLGSINPSRVTAVLPGGEVVEGTNAILPRLLSAIESKRKDIVAFNRAMSGTPAPLVEASVGAGAAQ